MSINILWPGSVMEYKHLHFIIQPSLLKAGALMTSAITLKNIPINLIKKDGGTKRRPLNEDTIKEYIKSMDNGSIFPPVDVVIDGDNYWLWHGFHRYECYKRRGEKEIPANVTYGNKHDAQWLSFGAHKKHELPPRAIQEKLQIILKDPEWQKKSDIEIGKHVNCSRAYVNQMRKKIKGKFSNNVSIFRNGVLLWTALEKILYTKEEDFEKFIYENRKTIFGEKTTYINTKNTWQKTIFGNVKPDGFLIGQTNSDKPYFYIVEVEIKRHNFSKHISPQIEDYFHLYNPKERHLADTICDLCYKNVALQKELTELKELFSTQNFNEPLRKIIDQSHKILIIIDGLNEGLEEKIKKDKRWKKNIERYIVNHFSENNNNIIVVEPSFQNE